MLLSIFCHSRKCIWKSAKLKPFLSHTLFAGGVLWHRLVCGCVHTWGDMGPDLGMLILETAGWIFSVQNTMKLSKLLIVQRHGHLPICLIWANPMGQIHGQIMNRLMQDRIPLFSEVTESLTCLFVNMWNAFWWVRVCKHGKGGIMGYCWLPGSGKMMWI